MRRANALLSTRVCVADRSDENAQYAEANAKHKEREAARLRALDAAREEHEQEVAGMRERADAQNAEVDAFRAKRPGPVISWLGAQTK